MTKNVSVQPSRKKTHDLVCREERVKDVRAANLRYEEMKAVQLIKVTDQEIN